MRKYKPTIISILFCATIGIFTLFLLIQLCAAPARSEADGEDLTVSWFSQNGIEIDVNDKAEVSAIVHNNQYSVHHDVERDISNVCIAFKNSFATTSIYVNDNLKYTTDEKNNSAKHLLFSFNAAAPQLHVADIGDISKGDVITINVTMYYSSDLYGTSEIMLGNAEDIVKTVFKNDLIGNALCVFLLTLGIILLIFHFVFRKVLSLIGLNYAGIFAIIASIYSIANSLSLSLLSVINVESMYIIGCLAFMTMLLPFIFFFIENTKFRSSDTILQVAAIGQIIVIVLLIAFAVIGTADLHQTQFVAQLDAFIQLLLIFGVLIYDFARKREKRNSDLIIIVLYAIFFAGTLVQYIADLGDSIPILFVLSSVFLIVAIMFISISNFAKALELSTEVEAIGKIAFTDGLTGVGNTAAFRKKMNHLEVVKVNYKTIGIIQFDINNLKTINDTLGHEMGDKLITDGSAIINKVFGKIGDVYRTGGDEFVAIVCCENAFRLCNSAVLNFERALEEYNSDEKHRFLLQIAYGVEYFHSDTSGQYLSLREIQKLADAKMYEKKREMKALVQKAGLEIIRKKDSKKEEIL